VLETPNLGQNRGIPCLNSSVIVALPSVD
jgi:hypothetical protein